MAEIMTEIMTQVYTNFLKFIEDQVYWYIFLFALVLILGLSMAKEKKRFLFVSMLIYAFVYVCPVTAGGLMHYGMGEDVYWRMFWLVPIPYVISAAVVLIASHIKDNKMLRFVCVIAILLIVGKVGKVMYQGDLFAKHANMYNLPPDVITLCDALEADAEQNDIDNKRLTAVSDLVCYIRQYDAAITMPYGRDGLRGAYDTDIARQIYQTLESGNTDWAILTELLRQDGTTYLACRTSTQLQQTLTDLRYRLVTSTGAYDLYAVPQDINYDGWIMMCYPDASGQQGEFFTFKNTRTGSFIVIDGGWADNAEQVRQVIARNGGVVDAWLITHYHNDHVDAFNIILNDPQGITIKKIYDTPLDYDVFTQVAQAWDTPDSYFTYLDLTEGDDRVQHLKRDDVIEIDGLKFEIFNAYDQIVWETCQGDIPNDCSLVFKVSGEKNSILFCNDCHSPQMAQMLMDRYGERLQAEYVQPGHHGNNSFPATFYDVVNPQVAIFNAPGWLMTGEDYTTKDLKEYFEQKGVEVYDFTSASLMFKFE